MNPYIIKPIKGCGIKKKPLGWELFPSLNSSIFISAGTKQGKTTNIKHIIMHCIDRRTKVFIFCPTVNIDNAYLDIIKYLDSKGIEHEEYPHFIDEKKIHILNDIMKGLDDADEEVSDEEVKSIVKGYPVFTPNGVIRVDEFGKEIIPPVANKKKKNYKYDAPPYLFIFDDLGNDLRKPDIYQLLMRQRHYKGKTIISSQYIKNLETKSIEQLDYILLYGGHSDINILELKKKISFLLPDNDFLDMYHYATNEKYNFMYIDRREGIIKKNYDEILYES